MRGTRLHQQVPHVPDGLGLAIELSHTIQPFYFPTPRNFSVNIRELNSSNGQYVTREAALIFEEWIADVFFRVKELVATQPVAQGAPEWVGLVESMPASKCLSLPSIKKPKTSRYPSLNGTDPKFRRNHRHALHGTMKALVRSLPDSTQEPCD